MTKEVTMSKLQRHRPPTKHELMIKPPPADHMLRQYRELKGVLAHYDSQDMDTPLMYIRSGVKMYLAAHAAYEEMMHWHTTEKADRHHRRYVLSVVTEVMRYLEEEGMDLASWFSYRDDPMWLPITSNNRETKA